MANRGRPRRFDREKALRLATRLFWERGYEGVSLSDLTEAMGIRPPSLYAAFGSKEALFREAVKLYSATEGADEGFAEAGTAKEAVEAMLHGMARRMVRAGQPAGCFVVLGALNYAPQNDSVARFLSDCRKRSSLVLRERLLRGQVEGDVSRHADVGALTDYYTSVGHGLSLLARDGANERQLMSVVSCAMASWDALASPTSLQPNLVLLEEQTSA
ncbi:AcrR family transcriptional regulator [Pseudorhizobium tarimense]|uniref:AcrR family transcriptional regulator n=1 Tax=Pseudorhizobium tarimense TaxID=1079109 RepID=A0ABV2HF16_9HYPH|nr:TetR/AcrR family transcriptional regulator [Pseudorhizobium tarimense]MCJ8521776.1 TetR/AcrR family transcriptional regulator [Pseudorhizobium tarimense]